MNLARQAHPLNPPGGSPAPHLDDAERRSHARADVQLPTVIFYDQRNRMVACSIRNISEGGARVELAEPADLSEAIQVRLRNGMTVNALVRWRIGLQAGLEFVG